MEYGQVDSGMVIEELLATINTLTYEGVLKNALIKQLKKEIEVLTKDVEMLRDNK